jgi:hypothetical protein
MAGQVVDAFQPDVVPDPALMRKVLEREGAKIASFRSIDLPHFRVDGDSLGRPWSSIWMSVRLTLPSSLRTSGTLVRPSASGVSKTIWKCPSSV